MEIIKIKKIKSKAYIFVIIIIYLGSSFLWGRVFITPQEAIHKAFPGAEISKQRVYLSRQQIQKLKEKLNFKIKHRFYSFYVARQKNKIIGYGILHTRVVRTKEMSIMVILNSDFRIRRIFLISFYEPLEYKPPQRWLHLFVKNQEYVPGVDIPVISGATLTSTTVFQLVNLTLELTHLLRKKDRSEQ